MRRAASLLRSDSLRSSRRICRAASLIGAALLRPDVCLLGALDEEEVAHLNDFCDRTQETDPKAWGIKRDREGYHINQGLIFSQPWLDNPELDQYAVNHRSFRTIVEAAMGGAKNVRTYEFNFRESPAGAGRMRMGFHHVSLQRSPLARSPLAASRVSSLV